jgi:general secretion pathway protein G
VRHIRYPARGFTLVEMLVTLAIVAMLASVALPLTQVAAQRTKEEELKRMLWKMRDAIDAYKAAAEAGKIDRTIGDSGYPATLETLVEGVPDKTSPTKARIYFLRRIPRDPMCDCPSTADAKTWGRRSYASPADAPREGVDVYDVYSQSADVGLNGIPYRQW